MNIRRVVVTALGCLVALAGMAAAQDENIRNVEQMIQNARNELQQAKAEAARSPTTVADMWEARLRVCAKTVECYERALAAARQHVDETFQRELQRANRWQSWGGMLHTVIYMEMNSMQVGDIGGNTAAKEMDLRQRIRAAVTKARGLCMKPLPQDPPDDEAVQQAWREMGTLQNQVNFLTQALNALANKKQTTDNWNRDQNQRLRGVMDKKLRLCDELVAALERVAAMDPQQNAEAYQQACQKTNDLNQRVYACDREYQFEQQRIEDEKQLAEAPAPLRPLLEEKMRCRAEGARLREQLERQDQGEVMRAMLEAKAEAVDLKAEALEEIIDRRGEALQSMEEIKELAGDPKVKPLLDKADAMLAEFEKKRRAGAEMEIAARELQARGEMMRMETDKISESIYQLHEKAAEAAEEVRQQREQLEDMARPEGIQEFVAELARQLQEFGGSVAETKRYAPAIADVTGAAREEALKRAQRAQDLMKAGRNDEAVQEIMLAAETKLMADHLTELLQTRVELEKKVAGSEQARKKDVQDCLAELRRASDAAAKLIVDATKLARDPQAAEKLAQAMQDRADMIAKAQEAAVRLANLLGGPTAE